MSRSFRMPDFLVGSEPQPIAGVIASLVDLGADPGRIQIFPAGTFRAYRGHLIDTYPPPGSQVAKGGSIRLYVAEHGIADRLPEGFLKPRPTDLNPDTLFDQVPSKRVWRTGRSGGPVPDPEDAYTRGLDGGRALLRILDSSLRRIRRDMTLLPQRLEAGGMDDAATGWLLRRFGLDEVNLDHHGRRFLSLHLPGFARAVGRSDETSALLSRLLGRPVTIRDDGTRQRLQLPEEVRARIGRSRLGVDCCVGAEFTEPEESVRVMIGPVPAHEREAMLGDQAEMNRLREITDMLMPAGRRIRVELTAMEGEEAAMLGCFIGGRLGETSRLNDRVRRLRVDAVRSTARSTEPDRGGEPAGTEAPDPPPQSPPQTPGPDHGRGGIRGRRIRIDEEE